MKKEKEINKLDKVNSIEPEFEFDPQQMRRVPDSKRHKVSLGDTDLRNCKVKITIYLDADILEHFKARAAQPNAAAYQTQINNALRELMQQDKNHQEYSNLLDNEQFIQAIVERVEKRISK